MSVATSPSSPTPSLLAAPIKLNARTSLREIMAAKKRSKASSSAPMSPELAFSDDSEDDELVILSDNGALDLIQHLDKLRQEDDHIDAVRRKNQIKVLAPAVDVQFLTNKTKGKEAKAIAAWNGSRSKVSSKKSST